MTRRPWLRHPPRTIPAPACPTGLPRFANTDRAREALLYGLAPVGLAVTACDLCGGAHLTDHAARPHTPPNLLETPMTDTPVQRTWQLTHLRRPDIDIALHSDGTVHVTGARPKQRAGGLRAAERLVAHYTAAGYRVTRRTSSARE